MCAQLASQLAETPTTERPLPTIWNVPDGLWEQVQSLIAQYDPPKPTGRPRTDARKALDGILYRLRIGCQWNQLPKEFGDDSSVHRTLQRWQELGLFVELFAFVVERCDELGGVKWQWQAADCCLHRTFGALKKGRSKKPSAPIPPIEDGPEPKTACS